MCVAPTNSPYLDEGVSPIQARLFVVVYAVRTIGHGIVPNVVKAWQIVELVRLTPVKTANERERQRKITHSHNSQVVTRKIKLDGLARLRECLSRYAPNFRTQRTTIGFHRAKAICEPPLPIWQRLKRTPVYLMYAFFHFSGRI